MSVIIVLMDARVEVKKEFSHSENRPAPLAAVIEANIRAQRRSAVSPIDRGCIQHLSWRMRLRYNLSWSKPWRPPESMRRRIAVMSASFGRHLIMV